MTPAKNLKFPPPEGAPPQPAKPRTGSKGYTNIDTELDEPILQALPAALWPTAYFLMKHRHMRPVKTPEVQLFTGKSASQVKADLARLETLGHAVGVRGEWAWSESRAAEALGQKGRKTGLKTGRKTDQETGFSAPENDVQDGQKSVPNKVSLSKTKKDNNTSPEPGVGRDNTMAERHAADTTHSGDAMQVVAAAGLRQIWKDWVALCGLKPVTQRAQLRQWADWIQEGRADALRAEAQRITEAGSYEHPFAGLKASMKKHATERANSCAAAAQARAAFGEPTCQPGERRAAPDGQVWTVEAVEYGMVFFAEGHAPQDVPDHVAAGWEVVA